MATAESIGPDASALEPVRISQLGWFFLKLGAIGFGGPIALAGAMQRKLVEERRWVSRDEYVEGLALAQRSTTCAPVSAGAISS